MHPMHRKSPKRNCFTLRANMFISVVPPKFRNTVSALKQCGIIKLSDIASLITVGTAVETYSTTADKYVCCNLSIHCSKATFHTFLMKTLTIVFSLLIWGMHVLLLVIAFDYFPVVLRPLDVIILSLT